MPDYMNVATLTKQVNNNLPPKRFLSGFFQVETLKTVNAELDTVEGTHVLAPFKREGAKRTVTKRSGYTKRPFHCYEIALERPTDAFDVLKAQPGEPAVLVDPMDANQRQSYILGNDTTDLSNRLNRTSRNRFFGFNFLDTILQHLPYQRSYGSRYGSVWCELMG